ncbi:MAG: hypothetical protein Q7S40_30895 [Opitutaceae bacterium]|nr:hypothetical protein [Opitutaceae bacterium]
MFKKPSKAQLKKKYGIMNNDFKILIAPEPPSDPGPGGFLERVTEWPKTAATFLWCRSKTFGLTSILAVVLVLPVAIKKVNEGFDAFRELDKNVPALVHNITWATQPIADFSHFLYYPFTQLPKPVAWPDIKRHVAITANTTALSTSGSSGSYQYVQPLNGSSGIYGLS